MQGRLIIYTGIFETGSQCKAVSIQLDENIVSNKYKYTDTVIMWHIS